MFSKYEVPLLFLPLEDCTTEKEENEGAGVGIERNLEILGEAYSRRSLARDYCVRKYSTKVSFFCDLCSTEGLEDTLTMKTTIGRDDDR